MCHISRAVCSAQQQTVIAWHKPLKILAFRALSSHCLKGPLWLLCSTFLSRFDHSTCHKYLTVFLLSPFLGYASYFWDKTRGPTISPAPRLCPVGWGNGWEKQKPGSDCSFHLRSHYVCVSADRETKYFDPLVSLLPYSEEKICPPLGKNFPCWETLRIETV